MTTANQWAEIIKDIDNRIIEPIEGLRCIVDVCIKGVDEPFRDVGHTVEIGNGCIFIEDANEIEWWFPTDAIEAISGRWAKVDTDDSEPAK